MSSIVNETFIEQLIIKSDPDIDDEALGMFVEDIRPVLYDWVTTHLANKLNDEQMLELADILEESPTSTKVFEYLSDIIPDYEKFMESVYDDFEELYLNEYEDAELPDFLVKE